MKMSLTENQQADRLLNGIIKNVLVKMESGSPENFGRLVPYLSGEDNLVKLVKRPEVQNKVKEIQAALETEKKNEGVEQAVQQKDPIDKAAEKAAGIVKKGRDIIKSPTGRGAIEVGKGAVKATTWTMWNLVKLANWTRRQTGDIKFAVGLAVLFLLITAFGPKKVAYGVGVGLEYLGKGIQAATAGEAPKPKPWYQRMNPFDK